MDKLWYICTMEYYTVLKEMSCQATKRHGGNWDTYWQIKSQSEETHCMTSIIWYSWGKSKMVERVKTSMVTRSLEKGAVELVKHVESFRVVKLVCMILWYMVLGICQTYWTLQHNFNVCKYLKNHLGSGGKRRMEWRMWVNNLTML